MIEQPSEAQSEFLAKLSADAEKGRRCAFVTERKVIGVAEKIVDHAKRANGTPHAGLNWDEWSTGGVEPAVPIRLGELREKFPSLVQVLETPSGDVEVRRDRIDDDTRVETVGYWRNPDGFYSAVQITLQNEDDEPRTIRRVCLESGERPERTWDNVTFVRQNRQYFETEGEIELFLSAVDQAGELAGAIAGSEDYNAYFHSHKKEVGKASWEKRHDQQS